MAARPTWKGYLKISLVNIPVRVFPATDTASSISFNQLHGECQTRIQQKKWCPHCDREVASSEIVKGYEFSKGRYVVMDDEDLSKVRPPSTRVIDLVQFADAGQLDPIYFDRPYYLAPDGDVAGSSFAVMREGMANKVGIGKLALYGREYLVAVQPRDQGLVMYTLRQAAEIRAMSQIEELDRVPKTIKPAEALLAKQVIDTFHSDLDLKVYRDDYQAELRRVIDAKIAGEEIVATPDETPTKVVDLMEALRRSLDAVSAGKKAPAKAELPKGKSKKAAAPVAMAADTPAEKPATKKRAKAS
jgi:DNA end-binding protein Ku